MKERGASRNQLKMYFGYTDREKRQHEATITSQRKMPGAGVR